MTPEEIQALIDNSLSNFRTEITQQFTQANQGLAASLTKEMKKVLSQSQPQEEQSPEESSESPKLSLKVLQQQIETLNKQLADKDKQTFEAERDKTIAEAIASSNTTNKAALRKLFSIEYANSMKKEGDKWFVEKDGAVLSVDDALSNYLKTEEGEYFIPPSGVQGSGTKESRPNLASSNNAEPTWESVVANLSGY